MNKKITDLKVEQVPCKKKGFREFKISYKYKGKPVVDYKIYDDEIYHDQLDHELYRLTIQETNARSAGGKLNSYARRYTGFTQLVATIGGIAGAVVLTSAIVPTAIILSRPYIEPDPEYTTLKVRNHTGMARGNSLTISYTLGDNISEEPATIAWGDGNVESLTVPGDIRHDYTITTGDVKNYDVVIKGDVNSIGIEGVSQSETVKRSIVDIALGKHITAINETSFNSLSGLKTIYIPSTVTTVTATDAKQPFYSCESLETIRVNPKNEKYYSGPNSNSLIDMQNKAFISGAGKSIIPNGVKKIWNYAFFGNKKLKSINVPSSVEEIGQGAFSCTPNQSSLSKIQLNNGLKVIGPLAFQYTLIESAIIPDTVTEVGNHAFDTCKNLETLKLSSNLVTLGGAAFQNCVNLAGDIIIPSTTISIGGTAFAQSDSAPNQNILDIYIRNPIDAFAGVKTFDCFDFALGGNRQFLHVPFDSKTDMVNAWGDPGDGADQTTWMGRYNQYGEIFKYNE